MQAATQPQLLPTPPPPPSQPLPLPPPPLSLPSPSSSSTSSTVPRRRHRRLASSSSSSTSSSSAASIFSPSPSPSRRSSAATAARGATVTTTTHAVVVPFSWELHPGIPKNGHGVSPVAAAAGAGEPLPLPPPLRASPPRRRQHRLRRSDGARAAGSSCSGGRDPFAAAFAECTREIEDGATATGNFRPSAAAVAPAVLAGRRSDASGSEQRWWLAGGSGFVGFLDLYGCKSAMAVADAAILARRRPVVARVKPSRRDK